MDCIMDLNDVSGVERCSKTFVEITRVIGRSECSQTFSINTKVSSLRWFRMFHCLRRPSSLFDSTLHSCTRALRLIDIESPCGTYFRPFQAIQSLCNHIQGGLEAFQYFWIKSCIASTRLVSDSAWCTTRNGCVIGTSSLIVKVYRASPRARENADAGVNKRTLCDENSYCLCALTFLHDGGGKMIARCASSICSERTLFVVVCDIPRAGNTHDNAGSGFGSIISFFCKAYRRMPS